MKYIIEKERIISKDLNGKIIAEITFPDGVIDHTFVDDSKRGQGIAGVLVSMAIEEIEKSGKTAKATCPYAAKWIEKNK